LASNATLQDFASVSIFGVVFGITTFNKTYRSRLVSTLEWLQEFRKHPTEHWPFSSSCIPLWRCLTLREMHQQLKLERRAIIEHACHVPQCYCIMLNWRIAWQDTNRKSGRFG